MSTSFDLAPGEILPLGEAALLLGTAGAREARRVAASLAGLTGFEVIAGLASVLVKADRPLEPEDRELLTSALVDRTEVRPGVHHHLAIVLDGEDLDEVVALTGWGERQIAGLFEEVRLEVSCVGFAPGFGYLVGLEGPLAGLPRRATPRGRVPAGSLAVAAGYAALYPQATPGGWWLLGRTDAVLFDPARGRPSLLSAGDTVGFRIVENLEVRPVAPTRRPLGPPVGVPTAMVVLVAPPGCSVVDDGRAGHGASGVARGGAFDPERAGALRRLLGGAPGALEVTGPGLVLETLIDCVLGAIDLRLEVDGRQVPSGTPVALRAEQRLEVVGVGAGGRGYLGVVGGPLLEPVLGSMGTDALSGLGPGWLATGDRLGAIPNVARPRAGTTWRPLGNDGVLRVMAGPHLAALRGGMAVLEGLDAIVAEPSNRAGLRLRPLFGPLEVEAGSLSSLPVVTGALQLPPDGCPVLLGPDHATLGGYPVIAVVIGADLGRLGRLSPGDEVELEVVSLEEAVAADAVARREAVDGPAAALLDDAR